MDGLIRISINKSIHTCMSRLVMYGRHGYDSKVFATLYSSLDADMNQLKNQSIHNHGFSDDFTYRTDRL